MSLQEIAQLISPAFIIIGGVIAALLAAKRWFERYMAGHHLMLQAENQTLNAALLTRLDKQDEVQDQTLKQTTATNGRVIVLETEHKADHDLLMTVVGKVEVLTGKQA